MAGYTRQSIADIVTGADILAAPLNNEFNQIQAAFHATTGHSHDGSTGNAPKIVLTTSVSGILPVANGGTNSATTAEARTSLFGVSTTTDNALVKYDGITGSIQNTGAILSDTNELLIGQGTPTTVTTADQLTVAGTTVTGILIENTSASGVGYITFGDGALAGQIYYDHADDEMNFNTGAATRATLSSTGLVLTVPITATTGTFSGAITGTTATFSGAVSASNFSLSGAPLPVSSGGTGLANLTSGRVLIGAGSSPVSISKAAPVGDFVGTSDTQTLTNKSIAATQLTGTIDVSRISGSYTSIVGTGALNEGSITSGFGSINIGGDALTAGAITGTTGTFSSTITSAAITSSSSITASQNFISSTIHAVFASQAAGNVYLRPNGAGSASGQLHVGSTGAATVNGTLTATSFHGSGSGLTSSTVPQASVVGLVTALADKADNDISILAGTGMDGGGTLAATRTLSVDATVWRDANLPADSQIYPILAAASIGEVGTYAFLRNNSGSSVSPGGTIAGSSTDYGNAGGDGTGGPGGTWRAMGYSLNTGDQSETTLFMRVS